MSSHIDKSLTSNQNKELKRLRRTRSRRILRGFLVCLVIFLIGYNFKKRILSEGAANLDLSSAREQLLSPGAEWANTLNTEQLALEDWLNRRGTRIESYLFDKLSTLLFISATKSLPLENKSGELGMFENFYLSVHLGVLRVSFMLLACFRLWIVLIAIALYRGTRSSKAYEGPDLMGETGNSRLFYSGIRAGLENLNEAGAPNKQITGLACPRMASEAKLKSSKLFKILEKYQVVNKTNASLAAVIVEYDKLPSYVPLQEEDKLLAGFVERSNLTDNTAAILERVLDLHSFYSNKSSDRDFAAYLDDMSSYGSSNKLPLAEYAKFLQKSLHRSLTPDMRVTIGAVPISHICTMVLSLEAGKVLVYMYEGERWQRKSNYPQLCSRAVLHSIKAFADEHNFNERTVIRQALIYASRSGDFGPVKLPVDLNDESRAMRQWTEVLTGMPHDLENITNEVEMYAIVYESHKRFKQVFFDKIMLGDKEMLAGTYATMGNLFLVPFNTIYKLTKQTLTGKTIRRLEELVKIASQKQRMKVIQSDTLVDVGDKNLVPAHSKVFDPLSEAELKTLSDTYGIPQQALRDWSSLRIILNNFGWLARRVGDYSVPDSSLIFAVMNTENGTAGANDLGLLGVPGMVPLRANQLEERWGKTWQTRTTQVLTATMAENKEDFDKFMRGETNQVLDENLIVNV